MPENYYIRGIQFLTKKAELIFYDPNTGPVYSADLNAAVYERGIFDKPDPLAKSSLTEPVQNWYSGKMGASATRYNPGQRFYFSPLGYMHLISDDNAVVANFKADGNVGTSCNLDFVTQNLTVIKHLCKAIIDTPKLQQEIDRVNDTAKTFFEGAKNSLTTIDDKEGKEQIETLMAKFPASTELGNALRDCIRATGIMILRDYYKQKGHKTRYAGVGVVPEEDFVKAEENYKTALLNTEVPIGKKIDKHGAEVDDLGKYTECVIHGTASNLTNVFASIDSDPIVYASLEQKNWMISANAPEAEAKKAIALRLTDLLALHKEFKKVNKDLQFGILDGEGRLYLTKNEAHIKALIQICEGNDPSWKGSMATELKNNFSALAPDITSELAAFEISEDEEDIVVTHALPMPLQTQGIFPLQPKTLFTIYPKLPPILKNQIEHVFCSNEELVRQGQMNQVISELRKLYLHYHPDKHKGVVQPGYHELYKLIDLVKGNKEGAAKEILAIVDKSEPVGIHHRSANPHRK